MIQVYGKLYRHALFAVWRRAAFLALLEAGRERQADVDRFVADLVWLGEAVEQVFPTARAFVRPGLDEPDAVARLRASGA